MAVLERLAVLQTDLRSLETIRPPDADAIVADYFDVLRVALEPEGGELIHIEKTSAIAIVSQPAGALRVVLRAHERLAHGPAQTQPPFLKAGADFGQYGDGQRGQRAMQGATTELAARCCLHSEGGDVVVSDAIRFDPDVETLLTRGVIVAEPFEVRTGQTAESVRLWRVCAVVRGWGQC